jgi:hypothetical protein
MYRIEQILKRLIGTVSQSRSPERGHGLVSAPLTTALLYSTQTLRFQAGLARVEGGVHKET